MTTQEPNPALIFETLNAHQQSASLRAAIELDLFTTIAQGAASAPEIAAQTNASERGARILCDYLTVIGFLTKDGTAYGLTPISEVFLNTQSPAYLGSVARFINSDDLLTAFRDVATLVREGTTQLSDDGSVTDEWEGWVEFAHAMAPMMAPAAEFIGELAVEGASGKLRVLDIAAGHGLFGIAVARENPEAEITALDWAKVLTVAEGNAESAGVADRYHLLPGSAFEVDFGEGFDVVLATNFFHHFDVPTCEGLMRKMHACLNPAGRVITLEFVPNEDRISPPIPAKFAMMMLGTTPSGDAYTFAEYDRMFQNAGFKTSDIRDVPQSPQQVVVSFR